MNDALTRTASIVLLHARAIGKRPPRGRRVPRQQYPHLVEVEYGKLLRAQVDAVRGAVAGIMPVLIDGATRDATRALEALRQRFADAAPVARLGPLAVRVLNHQAAEMDRQTRAVLGVPAAMLGVTMHAQVPATLHTDAKSRTVPSEADRITGWVHENVALIKDLADKPLREIEQLVTRAHAAGNRHETLARDIIARTGVAEDRAKVIARDQIGKLNGRVSADRHQRMGLSRFRWRGVLDARERPEHRALEGTEWAYAKPPSEGLPGEPIQCRCHDEPVFDDVLAELDRLEREETPFVTAPELPRAPVAPTTAPELPEEHPSLVTARRIVNARGTATAVDADVVAREVAKLPPAVLEQFHNRGVLIVVGRESVTDVRTDLRGVRPRGYPPGMTWDNVPGLHDFKAREVVVSTTVDIGDKRRINPRHGSADLVAHESGHALDEVRGRESSSDAFKRAYDQDLSRGNLGSYYTQAGNAGREEAYAESFAAYVAGKNPGGQFDSMLEFWRGIYGR